MVGSKSLGTSPEGDLGVRVLLGIQFKNFQGHEDSKFKLHPGINALVGANDAGKSSTFRGIESGIYNKKMFIRGLARLNKQPCMVRFVFSDGSVSRWRTEDIDEKLVSKSNFIMFKHAPYSSPFLSCHRHTP